MAKTSHKRSVTNYYSLLADSMTIADCLKAYLRLLQIKVTDEQLQIVRAKAIQAYRNDDFWSFMYNLPSEFGRVQSIKFKDLNIEKPAGNIKPILITFKNKEQLEFQGRKELAEFISKKFNIKLTQANSWVKHGLSERNINKVHPPSKLMFTKKPTI